MRVKLEMEAIAEQCGSMAGNLCVLSKSGHFESVFALHQMCPNVNQPSIKVKQAQNKSDLRK